MIPAFPAFTTLTREVLPEVSDLARGYEGIADLDPVVLWSWNRGDPGGVSRLHDNLVVRWDDPNSDRPYLAFTPRHAVARTADALLDHAAAHRLAPSLRAVPGSRDALQALLGGAYVVADDRDHAEYLLSVDAWVAMRGRGFRNRRNVIHRIDRTFHPEPRLLDLADSASQRDIVALCRRWAEQRRADDAEFIPELTAIHHLFDLAGTAGLFALGAMIDGRLAGFSINHRVITGTDVGTDVGITVGTGIAIGHFAKGDSTVPGISTWVLHHTCRCLQQEGVALLNVEQDLGVPGLRQSKLLLRPVGMLEKVRISRAT